MARPTKLTPELQQRIEQALRIGSTYELAAQYGGISYNCFNEWRKRGLEELMRVEDNSRASIRAEELPFVEFYEATQKAESEGAMGWLAKIEKAANDGNWQAAAWKLERRYPKDYGRTVVSNEHTGANGGAIKLSWEEMFSRSDDTDSTD